MTCFLQLAQFEQTMTVCKGVVPALNMAMFGIYARFRGGGGRLK